ncbi:FmdB family transcriptional regulator [Micromonospora sp. KC606]|uniref:FmdB family zinc ribbon protein n=1 Tax=Micromonospora sp. KC606 TaxID=2530379 RepID=UPI00104CD7F8|nr:FmdB family zinc ribbon protein [Micromonospora sp. KC606]TDC81787.1 FmdB family transcriptional regulator [Micromonospora sp. KC606]
MPTYQYACTACGHQLEAVQSFSDEPLTECPTCEGRLRKVFNSVGIVFKGSGFYRTDSRSAGSESAGGDTPVKPAKTEGTSSDSSAASSTSSSGAGTSGSSSGTGASGSANGTASKTPAASTASSS